jgi:hypothetical protein
MVAALGASAMAEAATEAPAVDRPAAHGPIVAAANLATPASADAFPATRRRKTVWGGNCRSLWFVDPYHPHPPHHDNETLTWVARMDLPRVPSNGRPTKRTAAAVDWYADDCANASDWPNDSSVSPWPIAPLPKRPVAIERTTEINEPVDPWATRRAAADHCHPKAVDTIVPSK